MNKKQMEFLLDNVLKQYASIIELFLHSCSEDDFKELPTVKMSKEENSIIEKHGFVFYAMRDGGDYNEENKIYSLGSLPFKIIIPPETSHHSQS